MEHGRLELKPGNGQACAPAPQTRSTGSPWILQRQPAPGTPQGAAPRPGRPAAAGGHQFASLRVNAENPARQGRSTLKPACACGKPSLGGGRCESCRRQAAARPGTWALPRLPIGRPGDALEREADAAADAVMAGRTPTLSRAAPPRVQREGAGIIPAGPLDLGDSTAARRHALPGHSVGAPHGTARLPDPAPTPCLRSPRCQLAIAGSNRDFAAAARAAESRTQATLQQQGASVAPRPAPEMTSFMRTSAPGAAGAIREVLVDPAMGGEGGAGAWHGPCPDDRGAACITVAPAWESEAQTFNQQPDAATIGEKTRAQWRFTTLQMMTHEAGHERFDRSPPPGTPAFTGRVERSTMSNRELSELFAQFSEFPVFYGEHLAGTDPLAERLRRLRDDYGARYLEQGEELSENIPGIAMRLRCMNPCADVDAALRATFDAATAGWPAAMRRALLTLLTDPAYGIQWPAPRQPALGLRAEPDGLHLGRQALQREATAGVPQAAQADAPPLVHEALRGAGAPMDTALRARFESRFGHDFAHVRIHTDARAEASARAVQARAYTVGRDIVFARGAFAPDSPAGQRLLAHELAHVVQQGPSRHPPG